MLTTDQPQTEAQWQAEYDARSLAESEKIKNDPRRLERAQAAAGRLAEKEIEEAKAMSKVAGRKNREIEMKDLRHRPAIKEERDSKKSGFNVFEKI